MNPQIPERPAPPSTLRLWHANREPILGLAQQLHARLPEAEPPITIHGRDLNPDTEGVGAQFQLLMPGDFYDGGALAAYFVVQVELVKQRTSLAWLVDAMPLLETEPDCFDLYPKRSFTVAYRDHQGLTELLTDQLRAKAETFFTRVRTGETIPEPVVQHQGAARQPDQETVERE
jgi:hypothetical protein